VVNTLRDICLLTYILAITHSEEMGWPRPTHPVSRAQLIPRNRILCCQRRHLKRENVFNPFSGKAEHKRRNSFDNFLCMEIYVTFFTLNVYHPEVFEV